MLELEAGGEGGRHTILAFSFNAQYSPGSFCTISSKIYTGKCVFQL